MVVFFGTVYILPKLILNDQNQVQEPYLITAFLNKCPNLSHLVARTII